MCVVDSKVEHLSMAELLLDAGASINGTTVHTIEILNRKWPL